MSRCVPASEYCTEPGPVIEVRLHLADWRIILEALRDWTVGTNQMEREYEYEGFGLYAHLFSVTVKWAEDQGLVQPTVGVR